MDPNMNLRHAQVHSADLHRRSELHRLAAQAREARRVARSSRAPRLQLAGGAMRAMLLRFGRRSGGGAALESETHRA